MKKSTSGAAFNIFFAFPLIFGILSCREPPQKNTLEVLPELPEMSAAKPSERGPIKEPKSAVIALVGEVRGEIEPCGCPTLPFGGFNRRETLLTELKQTWPVFHLDAGEMLLKGLAMQDRFDSEERTKLILSLAKKIDLDAWAAGPSDLTALGIKGLQEIETIPVINSNWVDSKDRHLLKPSVVVEKENVKIGVIGIGAAPTDKKWRDLLKTIPTEKAISAAVKGLPKDLDLIVALGSINDDAANQLANANLGIDLILTTRGPAYEEPTLKTANTLVIESPERGRYLQTIYTRLGTERSQPMSKGADDQSWRQWLLEQKQDKGNDSLAEIGAGRNLIFVESVALNKGYEAKGEVDKDIEIFKSLAKEKAKEIAESDQEDVASYFAAAGACARCHSKEFARWTFSDHAQAWQSLIKRKETENPECVLCHSTGFAKPGGFGEMDRVSVKKFRAVQCESCHGPMGGHPENTEVKSIPIVPSSCTSCHDEANSPQFEYGPYLKKSSCQM